MKTKSENTDYREELHAIKEEIISLRNESSQFLQKANQQQVPLQKIRAFYKIVENLYKKAI